MIKTAKLISIALLSSSVLTSSCSTGCISCQGNTFCTKCYQRYLIADGTCDTRKAGEHCDLYSNSKVLGQCSWCSQGYALGYNTGKCLVKSVPSYCVSATYHNGQVRCAICESGRYPSNDGQCHNVHTNQQCLWAGIHSNGNPACFRCIKGWSVDNNGNCQQMDGVKGCLFSSTTRSCTLACDPWARYFMYYSNGKCKYKWFGEKNENKKEVKEGFDTSGTSSEEFDLGKVIHQFYRNVVERF